MQVEQLADVTHQVFKRWATAVMQRYPELDVSTCHNYEISFAFRWQCNNPGCACTGTPCGGNSTSFVCNNIHRELMLAVRSGSLNAATSPVQPRHATICPLARAQMSERTTCCASFGSSYSLL